MCSKFVSAAQISTFPLTRRYPPGALARRARYAVPAGELHVRELGDVLPSAEPVQRFVVGVPVPCSPLGGLLPLRDESLAAAAARPQRPHGGSSPLRSRALQGTLPAAARAWTDSGHLGLSKAGESYVSCGYTEVILRCVRQPEKVRHQSLTQTDTDPFVPTTLFRSAPRASKFPLRG